MVLFPDSTNSLPKVLGQLVSVEKVLIDFYQPFSKGGVTVPGFVYLLVWWFMSWLVYFADSEGYRGESRPQGRRQVFKMAEGKWGGKTWTWRILKKGDRKSVVPVVHPTRPASHAEAPESVTLWEILTSEVQSRNSFFKSNQVLRHFLD